MGSCDIFFPTDFELLKRMHGEVLLWHVPMHLWLLWHVPIHMRHFLIISTEYKGPCDVDMQPLSTRAPAMLTCRISSVWLPRCLASIAK